jgi:hypothetical protein
VCSSDLAISPQRAKLARIQPFLGAVKSTTSQPLANRTASTVFQQWHILGCPRSQSQRTHFDADFYIASFTFAFSVVVVALLLHLPV